MGIPTGLELPFTFPNIGSAGIISVGSQPKARISFCSLPAVARCASDVGGCFERGSAAADCFVELNINDRGASMVMQKPKRSSLGDSRRYGANVWSSEAAPPPNQRGSQVKVVGGIRGIREKRRTVPFALMCFMEIYSCLREMALPLPWRVVDKEDNNGKEGKSVSEGC